MSERERWIVYPLVLFALGAALRDKILQEVEAKEIRCQRLEIIDQQDPDRVLAEIGFRRGANNDPGQLADRAGVLRIRDSDGDTICELGQTATLSRVYARQVVVVDINSKPLVVATTEPVPALSPEHGAISYQGVIYLNNQPVGLRIAAPRRDEQVPQSPSAPEDAVEGEESVEEQPTAPEEPDSNTSEREEN